jgi:2-polyprenyl-6-methoxyphenol hydroxylase-like FAD-dependent oxidoreductase
MYDTDVLIVGAGPSGLTLAASLVNKGVATTVVDRQPAGASASTTGSPTRIAPGACCCPATPPMCTARPEGRG